MDGRRTTVRGFTLAEMLVVISLIVIIAGITIPLFVSTRATTRRNDAVNTVQGALTAARQAAVERRTIVALEFVADSNDPQRGDVMVLVDKSDTAKRPEYVANPQLRRIGPPMPLPDFIKFDYNRLPVGGGPLSTSPEWTLENGWSSDPGDYYDSGITLVPGVPPPYPDIAYLPDGTVADGEGTTSIALIDVADTARDVLRVLPATGLVVRARHLQDPLLPEDPATNPSVTGWL